MLPVLPQCLSSELPLPCVLLAVKLLSVLVDHDSLAQQLCSHSGKAGQAGAQLWEGGTGTGTGSEPLKGSCAPGYSEKGLSEAGILFRRLPSPEAVHVHYITA